MRKKKSAVEITAPPPNVTGGGIEAQVNAIEQERLRATVSERLVRSPNDLRQELAATSERNRRRIERLEQTFRLVPDPERIAILATLHADLEQLLAVYWFFIAAQTFTAPSNSIRDPAIVTESLEPFSELLFDL
jgi:hypothetical protein